MGVKEKIAKGLGHSLLKKDTIFSSAYYDGKMQLTKMKTM
jgi:hypothetical protein